VLLEGLHLSCEVELLSNVASRHAMHVLRLITPSDQCIEGLIKRRRADLRSVAKIAVAVKREDRSVAAACDRLRTHASVEALSFDQAYARTLELLAICSAASFPHQSDSRGSIASRGL
jgi:hypothetical protein